MPEHTGVHFLQSPHWAKAQEALGRTVYQRSGSGWQYLAIVERGRLGSRLYCPYGPVITTSQNPEAALAMSITDLKALAKREKVDFLRIEPTGAVSAEGVIALGGKKAARDVQPATTIVNRLDLSEEELLNQVSASAKRNWRKGIKNSVSFRVSKDPGDIEIFITHINDVAKRTGMRPHSDNYFRQVASAIVPQAGGFLLAEHDGKPSGSIFYYEANGEMLHAHAASLSSARNLSPAYGLAIEALLLAQRHGNTIFDFYGAAPTGAPADHPWAGFTDFKIRFGGEFLTRIGTWEIPVNNLRYRFYCSGLKFYSKLKA